jgi:hypothetical protein
VSFDPFGHSPDLAQLANEGFELEITQGGHLLVKGIPYVDQDRAIGIGTLVARFEMNGDATVNPVTDHAVRFIGAAPCNSLRQQLNMVVNSNNEEIESGLQVNFVLSAKPDPPYPNYHAKVTAYVDLIEREAQAIDHSVSARTGRPSQIQGDNWPFEYVDTASGRAGIGTISGKLTGQRIAIVGLGGTGSYILDLVAKCPVDEIHLFDGDYFSTHNAFRAPGAASLEQLRTGLLKVDYHRETYSRMKRKIVAHPCYLTAENAALELQSMTFVFVAMDGGDTKRVVVDALESAGLPFVDGTIGVEKSPADQLVALVEVNGSTTANRESLRRNVDFGPVSTDDPYVDNIQIAELNALNAALAVLWWKKHAGIYYHTREHCHQSLNVPFDRLTSE